MRSSSSSILGFPGAIEQRLDQRRVAVERRSDLHFNVAVSVRGLEGEARQIALHVRAQRQEIGEDDDPLGAARDEQSSSGGKIRLADFEKGRFDNVPAGSSHLSGDGADGLVCALDARAVGEDNEPRHT
jgi:hypothetical protein